VNAEMSLEAVMDSIWRCTWRMDSSKFGDALRESNQARFKMHLVAMMESVWRCIWSRLIWRLYIGGMARTEGETSIIG
jgi:hypothetical protein